MQTVHIVAVFIIFDDCVAIFYSCEHVTILVYFLCPVFSILYFVLLFRHLSNVLISIQLQRFQRILSGEAHSTVYVAISS